MTRLFALRQISLFLLLVFAQPLAAIAQSDVWSADLESRVAAEMSRLVAAGRISGAVTLVADTQQNLLSMM